MLKCILKESKKGQKYPVLLIDQNNNALNNDLKPLQFNLGSSYDSEYAANRWIEGNIKNSMNLGEPLENIILFGLGDCQIAMKLSEFIPGRIFIYEPFKEVYEAVRHSKLFKKLQKNPKIVIEKPSGHESLDKKVIMLEMQRILGQDNVDTTGMFSHPAYINIIPEELESFSNICYKVIGHIEEQRIYLNKYNLLSRTNIIHTLKNMKYLEKGIPITKLKKVWDKEALVFLVSAGPSLKKNIKELKRVENKGIIISVDAALKTLLEEGIVPDMVACMDGKKDMAVFAAEGSYEIPYYIESCVKNELVSNLKNKIIWGRGASYFSIFLKNAKIELPKFIAPYGVAGFVFAGLSELGTKKLVFVGQDLAYSEDGQSHSNGVNEAMGSEEAIWVEGYDGKKVCTRNDWNLFREWIEENIARLGDAMEIINATEGGAKILGAKQKSLKEVVDEIDNDRYINLQEILNNEKIAFSKEELEIINNDLNNLHKKIELFREIGYEKTFFELDTSKEAAMFFVLELMRQQVDEKDRKKRFFKALDDFENILKECEI